MDDATDSNLNAYLDGTLSGDALKAFEQRLRHDADLRSQVQEAQRIDHALRRTFAGAPVMTSAQVLALAERPVQPAAIGSESALETPAISYSVPWLRRLGVAAALAGGVFGFWQIWQQVRPEPQPNFVATPAMIKSGSGYYNSKVATGFQPGWVCSNEKEFAHTFRYRLGQALALKPSTDAGSRMLGLDYAPVLSDQTVGMLAKCGESSVLLVIDRRENDNEPQMRAGCGSLHIFRRELGPLVMYEVSPLEQACMLDQLEAIE